MGARSEFFLRAQPKSLKHVFGNVFFFFWPVSFQPGGVRQHCSGRGALSEDHIVAVGCGGTAALAQFFQTLYGVFI